MGSTLSLRVKKFPGASSESPDAELLLQGVGGEEGSNRSKCSAEKDQEWGAGSRDNSWQ